MKIFVMKKNHMVIYTLIFLLTVGLVSYNLAYNHAATTATNSSVQKQLPIYCVENDKKQVAITFDCAWEDNDTDEIIKILNTYHAKATFFCVGEWVDRCGASVQKLSKDGQEIMNHSDQHTYPTKQSSEELVKDIESCSQKIEQLTGVKPTLYRAPAGDYNESVVSTVKKAGYQMIQWSVDSLDWKGLSVDEICDRVLDQTKSGDILLFHTGKENTPKALAQILKTLSDQGYTFVPVSELLLKDNYTIDANGMQKAVEPTVVETYE